MSTQSSNDSVRVRCVKQNLLCSVVQMISGSEICHGLMLPYRWEQTGESYSHGGHIGARRPISLDCCVIDVVNSVDAPSVRLVDTRGGEGKCLQCH